MVSKLYNLAKNDKDVQESIIVTIKEMINNKMIYEALVECLRFIVLFKKQPISEEGLKKEVLESVLNDTSISSVSLQEYLSLKLREGINYEYQLKNLAESGNAYACFELGSNEYYGAVPLCSIFAIQECYCNQRWVEKIINLNYIPIMINYII